MRLYRRELEALEDEKKKLEKDLAAAQSKLADGGAPKSEYDLGPRTGRSSRRRARCGCASRAADRRTTSATSRATLNELGLAPQDGPLIQQALQRSNARAWGTVQPLCSQALGGADVGKIGLQACMSVLGEMARQQSNDTYNEDVREVAEIMAGTRPAPAPGSNADPLLVAYLALARESQNIQQDLSQSIGPDDAQRVVYGDQGCWWNSSHGVGPRGGQ